jgi:hypothetical protein
MLTDMGLEPKKAGAGVYDVKLKHDGWDFTVRLSLSPSRKFLWMTQFLGKIPDVNKVPAAALAKLLTGTYDYCPCKFYFIADPKKKESVRLEIGRQIDNRGLTPALVRAELDQLCTNVKSSQPLWKDLGKTAPVTSKLAK